MCSCVRVCVHKKYGIFKIELKMEDGRLGRERGGRKTPRESWVKKPAQGSAQAQASREQFYTDIYVTYGSRVYGVLMESERLGLISVTIVLGRFHRSCTRVYTVYGPNKNAPQQRR